MREEPRTAGRAADRTRRHSTMQRPRSPRSRTTVQASRAVRAVAGLWTYESCFYWGSRAAGRATPYAYLFWAVKGSRFSPGLSALRWPMAGPSRFEERRLVGTGGTGLTSRRRPRAVCPGLSLRLTWAGEYRLDCTPALRSRGSPARRGFTIVELFIELDPELLAPDSSGQRHSH